jgi:hypothetical protein
VQEGCKVAVFSLGPAKWTELPRRSSDCFLACHAKFFFYSVHSVFSFNPIIWHAIREILILIRDQNTLYEHFFIGGYDMMSWKYSTEPYILFVPKEVSIFEILRALCIISFLYMVLDRYAYKTTLIGYAEQEVTILINTNWVHECSQVMIFSNLFGWERWFTEYLQFSLLVPISLNVTSFII